MCVKKKKEQEKMPSNTFFIRFFNVQQAQFVAKFFNEYIEYNNLQFLSRGTSKFKEDDGRRDTKSNKKNM